MKKPTVVILVPVFTMLGCSAPRHALTSSGDLRLFNAAALGQPGVSPVSLLLPGGSGELWPESISADIRAGNYFAATVRYPKNVTLQDARQSLNKLYKEYEREWFAADPQMGLWRNEDEEFAIQLTKEQGHVVAIYMPFH